VLDNRLFLKKQKEKYGVRDKRMLLPIEADGIQLIRHLKGFRQKV
jgi:hypothetical protein